MLALFIVLAILYSIPNVEAGHLAKGKDIPQFNYLCLEAPNKNVCHPIYEDRFIHCRVNNYPSEYICKSGFKFSYRRQKCTFAQYGDCSPTLTPEQAARITCPKLVDPLGGSFFCSNDNKYASVCVLGCTALYNWDGVNNMKCTVVNDVGRWSGFPGKCVLKAEDDRTNGTVHGCQFGDLKREAVVQCSAGCHGGECINGSICQFLCTEGTRRTAPVECRNGDWIHYRESCLLTSCPPIENVANGKLACANEFSIGSACSLTCDEGSDLYGEMSTLCTVNGYWENFLGTCRKSAIRCPSLQHFPDINCDAEKCESGNCQVGSTCELSCFAGETVSGREITECSKEGKWFGSLGICQKECPSLARNKGTVECTDSFRPPSSCRLLCHDSFHVSGPSVSVCTPSGNWTEVLGKCVEDFNCPAMSPPENGNLFCNNDANILSRQINFKLGSQCYVSCDEGYKLRGSPLATCSASGEWDKDVGICSPKCRMEDLPTPQFGNWNCTGDLNLLCFLQCDSGFKTDFDANSCVDGVWTKERTPLCEKVKTCTPLSPPSNSNLKCQSNDARTLCTVICNQGFYLSGNPNTTCADGNWLRNVGTCKSKCHTLQLNWVENGHWDCIGLEEIKCQLNCNEGYEATGNLANCSEGIWTDASDAFCSKIIEYCPLLSAPTNGYFICTSSVHNSIIRDVSNIPANVGTNCEARCDIGYQYNGLSFTNCSKAGTWTLPVGLCKKVCKENQLNAISNGKWQCSDNDSLICTVQCEAGYEIETGLTTKCFDGIWTQSLDIMDTKICSKIMTYCPLLPSPENGHLSCNSTMNVSMEPAQSGTFCGPKCENGYKYSGPPSTSCSDQGSWTYKIGICRKLCDISQLPVVANGSWDCKGEDDLECNLDCNESHRSDINSTSCFRGIWNIDFKNNKPICKMNSCPLIPRLPNGNIECISSNDNDRLVDPTIENPLGNSACLLTCNSGFIVKGSKTVICLMKGHWETDVGTCVKLCNENQLGTFSNGRWRCSGLNSMSCTVECNEGYEIEDGHFATCSNRTWTKSNPICKRSLAYCPLLSPLDNGHLSCHCKLHDHDSMNVTRDPAHSGTFCALDCNSGYKYTGGLSSITCSDQGSWTGQVGVCVKLCDVNELLEVDNGSWKCNDNDNVDCSLACIPYYESSIDKVSCIAGYWNMDFKNTKPMCKKAHCPKITSRPNGHVECSDSLGVVTDPTLDHPKINSACRLYCNSEFTVQGSASSLCTHAGRYDMDLGFCERTCDMNQLEPVSHGRWRCKGADTVTCLVNCNEGYATKFIRAVCHNGRWNSFSRPRCERNVCEAIISPSNGKITCSNDELIGGTICSLVCESRFSLVGSRTTICIESGTWTKDLGKCEPICSSTQLIKVEHGAWKCSGDDTVNCHLQCEHSYSSNGHWHIVCYNDHWSLAEAAFPKCIKNVDTCTIPEVRHGGYLECRWNEEPVASNVKLMKSGTGCSLLCKNGFNPRGITSSTCKDDGNWNNQFGTCRPICDPNQLNRVENGNWRCSGVEVLTCKLRCQPGFLKNVGFARCRSGVWKKPSNPMCVLLKATASPPTLPDVPHHRAPGISVKLIPLITSTSCHLPESKPNGEFQCPRAVNGRIPVGDFCLLKCKTALKMTTECTSADGWTPSLKSLACPGFALYTYGHEGTCEKPTPQFGTLRCFDRDDHPISGNAISRQGYCRLTCNSGMEPFWETASLCLNDGAWNNYLDCHNDAS